MLRTLGALAIPGIAIGVVAMDGRIGPVDLMATPPALIGFAAVSALVLLGLRSI